MMLCGDMIDLKQDSAIKGPSGQRWAVSDAASILHTQLCQQLAKKSVWQLRSGQLVGIKDGCFLQASGHLCSQSVTTLIGGRRAQRIEFHHQCRFSLGCAPCPPVADRRSRNNPNPVLAAVE